MNSRLFAIAAACSAVGVSAALGQTDAPAGEDALPNPLEAVEEAVSRIRASYEDIRLRFSEKDRLLRQAVSAQQAAEAQCRAAESRLQEAEADRKDLRERNRHMEGELARAQETIAGLRRTVTNLEEQVASSQREMRRYSQEKNELQASAETCRERMQAAERERERAREALFGLESRLKELLGGAAVPPRPKDPETAPPPRVAEEKKAPPKPETKPEPEPARPPAVTVSNTPALQLAPKPAPEPPAAMVGPPSEEPAVAPAPAVAPPIPEPILTNAPPATLIDAAAPLVPAGAAGTPPAAVTPDPAVTEELLAEASAAFDGGDWAQARSLYRKVLASDAANPVASVGLTEVLMQTGETREANDRARALLAADPASARRLFLAGRTAARDGRNQEAIGLLERAMAAAPENADVKRELAAVLFDLHRHQEAADMFVAVTRIDPGDGESWFNACAALLMSDPVPRKQALEYYEKALRLGEPRDERIEKRLGPETRLQAPVPR